MPDPKLINSPFSRFVEENGERVEIAIFRLEDEVMEWSLEIVAADGCSTLWEEPFDSDEAALAEGLSAIKDEGIKSFFEGCRIIAGFIEGGRGAVIAPLMGFSLGGQG